MISFLSSIPPLHSMSSIQAEAPLFPPVPEGLRLTVRHLTRFLYEGMVQDSFNDARLCPVTDALQRCESFELRLDPAVPVHTYHDFYLNRVDHFDLHHPHGSLEVESFSVVQTRPDPRGDVVGVFPPALLDDPSVEENYFDFLADSHFVTLDAEVWREAIDVLPNGVVDLWRDALALAGHLYRVFTYVPSATHAGTRVAEACVAGFVSDAGDSGSVCQRLFLRRFPPGARAGGFACLGRGFSAGVWMEGD